MERPKHLPDFDAPPLTEVALSLQFDPIARFGFVDFGPLRERFRPRFERVEYHPPLAPAFETFGLRQGMAQGLQINFGMGLTLPRLWLLDMAGNEILQFQIDRFVHNWRKIEVDNVYPRYEQIRERFETEARTLMSFLGERELGSLVPNQCEITYVNTIAANGGAGDPTDKVLKAWSAIPNSHLGEPEDVAITARFVIYNDDGDPIGRVIAQSTPGLNAAGQPVIQLAIVGRGPPAKPTLEAALQFMDIARERVVWAFAELTAEEMHKIWKRRN
jgi:uncharacterized protein (TIGR04255 family)